MSAFDDSDDDLMVPLSQRLGLQEKNCASPDDDVVICSSSSSSSVAEVTSSNLPVAVKNVPLRRCRTLNDFSPVTKSKKKNTPVKKISQEKEASSLSNSFSSCLTISSASRHSSPGPQLCEAVVSEQHIDSESQPSSSQISSSSNFKSQTSGSSGGVAPVKKISCRDCQAVVSAHFLTKHFKDEEIRKVFSENEVRFRYDSCPKLDLSVTFVREVVNEYENMEERPEDQVIVVIEKDHFVRMIHQYKVRSAFHHKSPQETDDDDEEVIPIHSSKDDDAVTVSEADDETEDLVEFVGRVSQIHPDKSITFIFTGIAAYFRAQRKKLDESYENFMRGKKPSKRKKKSDTIPSISQQDMGEALIDLQIRSPDVVPQGKHVNHYVIERIPDVMSLIASITRSVAHAPTKRSQKEMSSMDWFAENDKSASVDLKDIKKDSLRLWRKQLEQFPKVSREVADAIAKTYPTPKSLVNAYNRLDESSGRILLQDLPVGKNGRRVGLDISRKLHMFFTATDGSLFLGRD